MTDPGLRTRIPGPGNGEGPLRAALRRWTGAPLAAAALALCSPAAAVTAPTADGPRTAILCAYTPEYRALEPSISDRRDEVRAGVTYVTGRIGRTPVVLVESGISMVNATLAAQTAIDRYQLDRIIVMGVSGGADPALHIGDVVIPVRWRQALESVFARSRKGRYAPPDWAAQKTLHYGMIFPEPVEVPRPTGDAEMRTEFPADANLLDVARTLRADATLESCTAAHVCLSTRPRLVVEGVGVTSPAFIDNADFRRFERAAFGATALDMETAAVAQVAYMNKTPFLAIRSLSDLAGGGGGATELKTFEDLASRNAVTVLKALLARLPPQA